MDEDLKVEVQRDGVSSSMSMKISSDERDEVVGLRLPPRCYQCAYGGETTDREMRHARERGEGE